MADATRSPDPAGKDEGEQDIPWMQQFLDNPFLLLFLGVMVPMVLYVAWGVWDILTVPIAK
ncbi:MAG: hypothetical protein IT529_20735 [Burkholderiales bacterium]|nr:hypothetical protein [Burkholderiales bacterium]